MRNPLAIAALAAAALAAGCASTTEDRAQRRGNLYYQQDGVTYWRDDSNDMNRHRHDGQAMSYEATHEERWRPGPSPGEAMADLGWTDSDIRCTKSIRRRLGDDVACDGVSIETHDGRVTLRGRVSSWDEKRRAERACDDVVGASNVDDRIVVDRDRY